MEVLDQLIYEFWAWTQLPNSFWGDADLANLPIDAVLFPKIGEICDTCIKLINTPLTPDEVNKFLMGLAIDSEDEDILENCMQHADDLFLYNIVSVGISHPQSYARWQLAELLRRPIPQREYYLYILLEDSNEYVRTRANNVARDISQNWS